MRPRFKVFLSAVTSECGEARKLVASDLCSRGLEVRVQEDFRQEPGSDTTLGKLHNYVRDCDAVVAIIGERSGSFPPADAAEPFKAMLPQGFDRASMTQWEVLFARHYRKRMSIYVASKDRPSPKVDANADDDPASQQTLRDHLFKHQGLDRSAFDSPADLSRLVLKEPWPDFSRPPPKSDRFVSIGSLFKGREDAMKRLRESLEAKGRTAVTAKAQALHGMGGLGKTRLAIEYGLAHEKDYSALLFLSGETPAALEASLQGLAGVLGIPDHETLKEEQRRREVLDWLRHNPGWFLVVDNLDTPEALKAAEGLLAHMSEGHAVITTRLSDLSGYFEPLELDVLTVDASVEFLNERTVARRRRAPDEDSAALAIASDLGQLALALEIAGAYIAYNRKSFADYRIDWARQRAKLLDWHSDTVTGYPRSVADAFLLSFALLTPAARALLEHLAFLAPEPVPERLLEAPIPGFASDAADALVELDRYSLVKRLTDRAAFTMHRLVQDVARRGLTAAEADARCLATLRCLIAAIDPGRFVKEGKRREALLALELHAAAAAGHVTSDQARDAARYLLVQTGDAFVEGGHLERALRLFSDSHECCLALAAADPENAIWQISLGIGHERMGGVFLAQGDLSAALERFEAKRDIVYALTKADPGNAGWRRDLSVSYEKVGEVQVAQGDLPGRRRVIAIRWRFPKV